MGNTVGAKVDTAVTKVSKVRRRLKNVFDVFEGTMPQVLLLGLDGAGKTTFLYNSKLDETIYANLPPPGVNIEQVTPVRGATLQVYDLAGNKMVRHHWCYWFKKTEAIIFVVDAADRERVDEAAYEFSQLTQHRGLREVPIAVVANKQDVQGALSKDELNEKLELDNLTNRDWSIFEASAENKEGIKHVFKDIVNKIKHRRAILKENYASANDTEAKKTPNTALVTYNTNDTRQSNEPTLFASLLRDKKHNDGESGQDKTQSESRKSSMRESSAESVVYDNMDGNIHEIKTVKENENDTKSKPESDDEGQEGEILSEHEFKHNADGSERNDQNTQGNKFELTANDHEVHNTEESQSYDCENDLAAGQNSDTLGDLDPDDSDRSVEEKYIEDESYAVHEDNILRNNILDEASSSQTIGKEQYALSGIDTSTVREGTDDESSEDDEVSETYVSGEIKEMPRAEDFDSVSSGDDDDIDPLKDKADQINTTTVQHASDLYSDDESDVTFDSDDGDLLTSDIVPRKLSVVGASTGAQTNILIDDVCSPYRMSEC